MRHLLQAHHILQAEDHPGICGQAIAAGAAGFLVIGFDAFGQVKVGHKAHIRLIYAHTKGDGGDNNNPVVAQKAFLVGLPQLGWQPGMVGQGGKALLGEPGGGVFDLFAGQAVDYAGFVLALF